jgi:hypothetical protein
VAHYAFLDESNVVTEVITGKDEGEDGIDWEEHYGNFRGQVCKRTSYNTVGGVHKGGGTPFRKNYAGIGYTYNADIDAFVPPKPYASWTLNNDTALWEPPVPKPLGGMWTWNEEGQEWVAVEMGNDTVSGA